MRYIRRAVEVCTHYSVVFRFRNDSDQDQQYMGSSTLREGTAKSASESQHENRS